MEDINEIKLNSYDMEIQIVDTKISTESSCPIVTDLKYHILKCFIADCRYVQESLECNGEVYYSMPYKWSNSFETIKSLSTYDCRVTDSVENEQCLSLLHGKTEVNKSNGLLQSRNTNLKPIRRSTRIRNIKSDFQNQLHCEELQKCGKKRMLNPYACPVCHKDFRSSCNLKIHLRIHTGDRPFACSTCSNKFKQLSHLISHMRRHSGEKPWKCEFCNASFIQKTSMKNHISKMHYFMV